MRRAVTLFRMREVKRSAILPYPAQAMYALVDDVESYPEFLPWCRAARVVARDGQLCRASLQVARGGFTGWFTTENTLDPPRRIALKLVDGPFRTLEGAWSFEPLGEDACKVTLDLRFEFENRALDFMVGPLFQQIGDSLLDAFVRRAEALHGRR